MKNSTKLQSTFTLQVAIIALVSTLFPQSGTAQTDTDPALQEWTVPYENSTPRDPMVAPDGRVWFVGQTGDYVSVLDPMTGDFEKYDLDDGA